MKLIEKIADLLVENGDLENAKLNYLLVRKIRKENKWTITPILSNKINNLKDINLKVKKNELINICVNNWHKFYYSQLEKGE